MVLIVTNKKLFSSALPGSAILCSLCVCGCGYLVASIGGDVCVCVGVYVLDGENKGQSTTEKV